MNMRYWSAVVAAAIACWSPPVVAAFQPGPAAGGSDWLRIAPGDAHFYVEVRDLAGIRRLFNRLGIWKTVRELTERESPAAASQPWQRIGERFLNISSERAIHEFLGRRAALLATEPAYWQNGVVLAEMENSPTVEIWLRRWRAKPLAAEGSVQRYELPGGIMLATQGQTLVFGPAGDPEGLWNRTVLLLAGSKGPTLAGRSEFAALRSRLSASYPCLLYVVWPEGDANALGNCIRLLAGASVTESGITCELHGQRSVHEKEQPPLDATVLTLLPDSTLAVRAGSLDFRELGERVTRNQAARQDRLLLLILRGLFGAGEQDSGEILDGLGPNLMVVIARDPSSTTLGFEMPAVTAICKARLGPDYILRLDRTIRLAARLLARISQAASQPADPLDVEIEDCEGVELHHIKIGGVLAERSGLDFLHGLDLCWTLADEKLIVSSSLGHVRELIRASRGKAPRLTDGADLKDLLPAATEEDRLVEWWFARGDAVAQMVGTWVEYLQREQPEALRRDWWQDWAAEQLEDRTRLGLGLVKDEADPHRARVKEIARPSPAARFLRVGDVIVAAAGSPLATTQPAQEVAERYAARGNADKFELQIVRQGKLIDLKIPVLPAHPVDLHGFDPVRALNQLMILSKRARTATMWRYANSPERFDARILVRWEPAATTRSPSK